MKCTQSRSRLDLPQLAIPWHQQLVMRLYWGPVIAGASNFMDNRRNYEGCSQKIIELAEEVPLDLHSIPVLVPSQAGLLDDTRYWSISMTLEHLLKLDTKAKEIILRLARGTPADILVTPANVAPTGQRDAGEVLAEYREFVPQKLDEIEEALKQSDFTQTEVHPIFGAFNARQWQWSLATRSSLRLRQLKNIRKGLTFTGP